MIKTAEEVAEYVLFKIAMEELFEKNAWKGMGGNWPHVWEQLERLAGADKDVAMKVLRALPKKLSKAPGYPWYKPMHRDGKLIGHLVGQGQYISSVYKASMTPRGRKW